MAACQGDALAQVETGPRIAVDQLFLGIRMGNATMLLEVFAPDVRFAVPDDTSGGRAQIAAQTLDGFIRAVEVSKGA